MILQLIVHLKQKAQLHHCSVEWLLFCNHILNQDLYRSQKRKTVKPLRIHFENCSFRWRNSCLSIIMPFCWESHKKWGLLINQTNFSNVSSGRGNDAIFHVTSWVVFFVKIYFTVPKVLAGYFPSAVASLLLPSEYVALRIFPGCSCLE